MVHAIKAGRIQIGPKMTANRFSRRSLSAIKQKAFQAGAAIDHRNAKTNIGARTLTLSNQETAQAEKTCRQYHAWERPLRKSSSRSPASASSRSPGERCSSTHVAKGGGSIRLMCALLSTPEEFATISTEHGGSRGPGVIPRA